MNRILLFLVMIANLSYAQNILHAGELDWSTEEVTTQNEQLMKVNTPGCAPAYLSTGYPAWSNYWAGWMVNIINTNACPITINSFEARFQGTAGYRIYTKIGTFVGFQTTAGAWTLVGNLATLTGTSTIAPTAIPIAVNVTIPSGGTQAFYLTRSDNVIANRHLYVTGAGTAGTTIYASNADLSITEGNYVDPYFAALQVGVRRPSFDVCYTISCPLPIELAFFSVKNKTTNNSLEWITESELNNEFFIIERSNDAINFTEIGKIKGGGTTHTPAYYKFDDYTFLKSANYYRLKQIDYNGKFDYSNIIVADNGDINKFIKSEKIYDLMGKEYSQKPTTMGVFLIKTEYSDNTVDFKKIILDK